MFVSLFNTQQLVVEDSEVDTYLNSLEAKIVDHMKAYPDDKFVVLHLGVNAGLKEMEVALERRCFNGKCFENKNVPVRGMDDPIDSLKTSNSVYRTLVPINTLHRTVKKKHPCVRISDDPGRYLCNYIYYQSCRKFQKLGVPSMFIHVPNTLEPQKIVDLADIVTDVAKAYFDVIKEIARDDEYTAPDAVSETAKRYHENPADDIRTCPFTAFNLFWTAAAILKIYLLTKI